MFKKLVAQIAEIKTRNEFNEACGAVDIAFQREKISWNDHEILYRLLRVFDYENLPA